MGSLKNFCLFMMIGVFLLTGCSGKRDRPSLGTVTGKVFMDGQPLPNVWIMFIPTTGRTSIGRADKDGKFELMYLEGVKGANLGTHKVVITTYNEDEIEDFKAEGKFVEEPIPAKYNHETTLTETVKEGKNNIEIRLESK